MFPVYSALPSLPLSPMVPIKVQKFGGTLLWLSRSLWLLREVLGVEPIACVSVEGTEAQEGPPLLKG